MTEILTWPDEGGSVYYQARRFDGFDYRSTLTKASLGNTIALSRLFEYTKNGSQMGEGAETHIEVLGELLKQWGDADYAVVLHAQPAEVITSVAGSLNEFWGYPGWPKGRFPETEKLCNRTPPAEQASGGNGGQSR
ncbi:hypothetical protein JIN85_19725 [Luteolibacter pohnpeiensis]|uniref:Uncharacterized protein n=1 Tax=Luteolibacter pohnpeiensis TaxID=454153 RepID=A0A934SAY5_9BACT|nr:hypothetical protein [Luteolibacter pohnpeiensis]MBK1884655.1 hypothetical protein [Luteolibacter pohnpeiensis]